MNQRPNPEIDKPLREGVSVLAVHDGKVLLGRRLKEPNYGKWVLPGGGIDAGETKEQTAVRELNEEAGIDIKNVQPLTVTEVDEPDKLRRIYTVSAEIVNPEAIKGGTDLGDPRLFTQEELKDLDISDVVRPVLARAGWLDEE